VGKNKDQTKFGFSSSDGPIEKAKKVLIDNGYRVVEPIKDDGSKNTLPNLVSYFYNVMHHYNPDRRFHHSHEESLDRQTASKVIKDRQSTGVSRERAFTEVKRIIDSMFKYEQSLGLDSPITSMNVLNVGWIVKKVINIINDEDCIVGNSQYEEFMDISDSYTMTDDFKSESKALLNDIYSKVLKDGTKKERP